MLVVFKLSALSFFGQNLVYNPSFELAINPTNCGNQLAQGEIPNWGSIASSDWFSASLTSPNFFCNCQTPSNAFGIQVPKTGIAYAGFGHQPFWGGQREFFYSRLLDTLRPGKHYCVSMYASFADSSMFAVGMVGMHLSDTNINSGNLLYVLNNIQNYAPQIASPVSPTLSDKLNWTRISGLYSPATKNNWITIGCFRPVIGGYPYDSLPGPYGFSSYLLAYYYIDDVSVTEVKSARAGNDTLVSGCDSIMLGKNYDEDAEYLWWPGAGIANVTAANPMVLPPATGWYYVRKKQCEVETIDSVYVQVIPKAPPVTAGADKVLCKGNTTSIGLPSSFSNTNWLWQPATGLNNAQLPNPLASPQQSTTYVVRQSNHCNDTTYDTVYVQVSIPQPAPQLMPDTTFCMNSIFNTTNQSTCAYCTYSWSPTLGLQNSNQLNTIITLNQNQTYTITQTDSCHSTSSSLQISIRNCELPPQITMPNVFTPNGDGINDYLLPVITGDLTQLKAYSLHVYDRWGILVFSTRDYQRHWDGRSTGGTQMREGVYYYTLTYQTLTEEKELKGFVELVR